LAEQGLVMPVIRVHIIESQENPTGVGEPGTPVIAPATANALYAATGKRVRRLSITADTLA
jgi:isoquinoline 1-oxidoreductase beta subunit